MSPATQWPHEVLFCLRPEAPSYPAPARLPPVPPGPPAPQVPPAEPVHPVQPAWQEMNYPMQDAEGRAEGWFCVCFSSFTTRPQELAIRWAMHLVELSVSQQDSQPEAYSQGYGYYPAMYGQYQELRGLSLGAWVVDRALVADATFALFAVSSPSRETFILPPNLYKPLLTFGFMRAYIES